MPRGKGSSHSEGWPELPAGILVHPRLFTAGQPSEEQMSAVARAGCRTVINLALTTSTNALPDERKVVSGLGMEYVHLPVVFEQPTLADFLACESALLSRRNEKVLLH